MALLATSCTMRNKPSRLLDKGPDYLRTRTNDQIFANRRKSAVELLAASRPQYVKSAALLDPFSSAAGLTAGTPDRHYRSICQPRERPPVRSKSEFDVSKLHELIAQDDDFHDDVDGDYPPRETTTVRRLSEDLRPFSARGRKEEAEEEEEEERCDTSLQAAASPPGDSESGGERKINSAPDRQDESQRFFRSRTDVAATTTSASAPPPAPPSSHSLPFPTSVASPDTQSAAPALYTARPIYINLSRSPPSHTATAQRPSNAADPTTPVNRSIRVFSAASRFLSPTTTTAMSEESLDKTPTNPTGGDMTPGEEILLPPAPVQEEEDSVRGRERGGSITSAPLTSGETVAAQTSSTSSSPGPRLSLRNSGEFVTVGSMCGFNPVPRSFSDISCHHSQAGSDVSSETSRASRASAGANLERFFNEMGMDRDILDPMIQIQQRRFRGGSELDIYDSVSSLESHGDARSICSALSRSEKEISDAESFERNQQQTSVVERNARIIKWLCSVRKAKTPAPSVQGSAAS